jgi:hypothetical protein
MPTKNISVLLVGRLAADIITLYSKVCADKVPPASTASNKKDIILCILYDF